MKDTANILIGTGESFVGSMAALLLWIHFDLDERWRRWSVRRGHRIELRNNPRLRAEHARQQRDQRRDR